jgi:hypothetical protein
MQSYKASKELKLSFNVEEDMNSKKIMVEKI